MTEIKPVSELDWLLEPDPVNDCSVPADRSVDSGIKSFPAKFSRILGKVL